MNFQFRFSIYFLLAIVQEWKTFPTLVIISNYLDLNPEQAGQISMAGGGGGERDSAPPPL